MIPAHYLPMKIAEATPEVVAEEVAQAAEQSGFLQAMQKINPLLFNAAMAASAILAYKAMTHETGVPSNDLAYPNTGHRWL